MSEQLYPFGTLKHEMEKVALLGFGNKKQPDEFDQLINQRNEAINQLKSNAEKLNTINPKPAAAPKASGTPPVSGTGAPKKPVMRDFAEHFTEPKAAPVPDAAPTPVGSRVESRKKGFSPKGKLGLLGGLATVGGTAAGVNAMKNKKEQEKVASTMANRFLSKQANEQVKPSYHEDVVRENIANGDLASVNPAGAAIGGAALAALPAHMMYSAVDNSKMMDPKERTRSRLNMADPKDGQVMGRPKDYFRHLPTEEMRVKRMRGGLMGAAGAGIVGAGAGMAHLSNQYNAELERQLEEQEQLASYNNQFLNKQANEEVYQALQLAEERRKAAEYRDLMLEREKAMVESRDDTIGSLGALGLVGGGYLGAGLGYGLTARTPIAAAGTIGGGLLGGFTGMMGGAALGERLEGNDLEEFRKNKLATAVANHKKVEDQFQARMLDKRAFEETRFVMNKIASYYR